MEWTQQSITVSQTSSTYMWRYYKREGPTGGLPCRWSTEIGPASVQSWPPPRFPDPTDRGMANTEEGAISNRPPPRRGKKRKRVQEGLFQTAPDGDGGGHHRMAGKLARGPGCQASPPTQRHQRERRCYEDSLAKGPYASRRDDLSEQGSPESAPHRPWRRWETGGKRAPPPIFELGEGAMPPMGKDGIKGHR